MSDLPSPKKHKTSNWSAIWVLPLVALAIGAWLAWRAFDQAGVDTLGLVPARVQMISSAELRRQLRDAICKSYDY
ncbi:hypothetical protein LDY98_34105, partial [Pseudomonas aeruginosa]|nr:hypothetical protein [Pseudomonas aeruginosa]